jgi:RimJ/RimL family protein N-acetyltransferase
VRTLESAATSLRFAPLDRAAHRELLRDWFAGDHVRPWWGVGERIEAATSYIDEILAMAHQRGWVVADADGPFGYVESYVVSDDPLADCYDVLPGDRGFHLLVGPPERLGTPATRALAVSLLTALVAEPTADRALCEPNVRNARMRGFCASLGAEQLAEFPFLRKTAALLGWTAHEIASRWPDAYADAVRRGRRWDAMDGNDGATGEER